MARVSPRPARDRRAVGRGRVVMGLGVLVVLVGFTIALSRHAEDSPILRSIPLGRLNIPALELDRRHGRLVVVESPQGDNTRSHVFVLDTHAGRLISRVDVGTVPLAHALDEHSERLYVTSGNTGHGHLYTVDLRSGSLLSDVRVGIFPSSLAVDERTRRVFVVNASVGTAANGSVEVFDARSGRLLRTTPLGRQPEVAALDESAGRVFVANIGSNSLAVLDARDGQLLASARVAQSPAALPDFVSMPRTGRIFAVTRDTILMLDAVQGSILRTSAIRPNSYALLDNRSSQLLVVAKSAHGEYLYVLDGRSGAVRRAVRLGANRVADYSWGPMLDETNGRAYMLNGTGGPMIAVDVVTGRVLWRAPIGPYASVEPDNRDGCLLVVTSNAVQLLDARSGRLLHTFLFAPKPIPPGVDQIGTLLSVYLDGRNGHAFVVDTLHDTLSELEVRAATLRRVGALPVWPYEGIVDDNSRRLYLVSLGGTTRVPDPWGWAPSWLRRLPFFPSTSARTRTDPAAVTIVDMTR